nr:mRNA-decapping enzyme-like protein [Ipomoea batatas]
MISIVVARSRSFNDSFLVLRDQALSQGVDLFAHHVFNRLGAAEEVIGHVRKLHEYRPVSGINKDREREIGLPCFSVRSLSDQPFDCTGEVMSFSQTAKLMPNLDERSTKVLNLTVLQRIDPFIEEILITAAHVTFYEFNVDLNQWSRKDVEGSLFVVKRGLAFGVPSSLSGRVYGFEEHMIVAVDALVVVGALLWRN